MNIDKLIHKYFNGESLSLTIEVFDNDTIYNTYTDIVRLLNGYPDIELTMLQGLSYCFYEVLDNVLTHSEKICGTVLMRYLPEDNKVQILVADDGIGIKASLCTNPQYAGISEEEAVRTCIMDGVTDGKGMGFGLYSTSRLIQNVGITLEIHSGNSMLIYDGLNIHITEASYWQGTIVYFELHSNKEINPNDIVDNRTDCEGQFNDEFAKTDELDNLW
ncbi:MAG: ATP-binding protein [Bacteroides sp]|nr:ATP-binding protein [Bacteroides sp.]